jgi:hypothetical protein
MARTGRIFAFSAALIGAVALTATPRPAYAVSPGWAAGIGLGAFTLGAALGAGANPYYYPYYNPYYYYPPPAAYYPPAPYYGPHRCWDPYYYRWYAC